MAATATALGAAFEKKGVNRNEVEFSIAVVKFLNNGGTIERAHAVIDAADQRPGSEGHSMRANNGRGQDADASQRTTGQQARADKARASVPVVAQKPGHAKRGMTAIASVQGTMMQSLFDRIVLADGRRLREVRWSECPALAQKYRRDSRILLAVHNFAIPPDPSMRLDAIVNEDELKSIITAVERLNAIE
jgi:hypothetical protein